MLKRASFVIKSVIIICFVFLFSSVSFAESDNSQKRVQRIALPSSYTVRLNDGFHDMELAPGFRDMNFGDTAEKLGPHAKLLSTLENGSRKLYTRTSDKLKAGNVPLRVIVYEFKKKLLTTIYLYSDLNNLEAMRELCSSKYGDPVKMKDETNCKEQYAWLTGSGLISLSQTELGAQLAISDMSVRLLADSDLHEDEIVLLPGFRHMRIGHPFRSYADDLKICFEAENGYGWYGDYKNSKDGLNHYWSDTEAKYLKSGTLCPVDFERETFNYGLGIKSSLLLFKRYTFSLDFCLAIFTQINSIDKHYTTMNKSSYNSYLDKMQGFFKSFTIRSEFDVKIWKGLSAGAGFKFVYINQTLGNDYSKTSSETKYSLDSTVNAAASGYSWNVEAFVRYSF